MNREEWLGMAARTIVDAMLPAHSSADWFQDASFSVGFPQRRTRRGRLMWDHAVTEEGRVHVFVSPLVDNSVLAMSVLLHAIVNIYNQQLPPVMRRRYRGVDATLHTLGFAAPYDRVVPTQRLLEKIGEVLEGVPDYPHEAVAVATRQRATQPTRLLKLQCDGFLVETLGDSRHEPYIIRISRAQYDRGKPGCGVCRMPMLLPEQQHDTTE